jgi:DNA transposition AAA+ family ATPase
MSSTMEEAGESLAPGQPAEYDAIRAAVRAAASADGITMTAVAKQAGVPYGTFSSWLGGTYAGRNDLLAEKALTWLDSREARASTRISLPAVPSFVATASATAFLGVLNHAQHMPDLVVIAGGAGVGKTTACNAYKAQSPNVWIITAQPCYSTVRMLLEALTEALEIAEKFSAQRISSAIMRKLTGSGGLLIVDEAQHLSSQSLDQLRTIHDIAGIGVALVGNETVFTRFGGLGHTPQYAQLFSRVGVRLTRKAALRADIEKLLDVWKIEGKRERDLLTAIARKPGALRGMTKTLRMAFGLAAASGLERPAEEHVLAAWSQLGNAAPDIAA